MMPPTASGVVPSLGAWIVPGFQPSAPPLEGIGPAPASPGDVYVARPKDDVPIPCGEVRRREDTTAPQNGLGPFASGGSLILGLGALSLFEENGAPSRFTAASGFWSETNAGFWVLGLAFLAAVAVIAKALGSSRRARPKTGRDPAPAQEAPPSPSSHRPRKPTLKLPGASVEVPDLHGDKTGPVAIGALPPPMVSVPDDKTARHFVGTVERAMPDDRTKGHEIAAPITPEEATPRPARDGTTEPIVMEAAPEEASPRRIWGGTGTRPLTEKILLTEKLMIGAPDVITAASPPTELRLERPEWALVPSPQDERNADPAERARLQEGRRRQRDYLLEFQGPRGHPLIGQDVLASAIRFLGGKADPSGIQAAEVCLTLSFCRLIRMGVSVPSDLKNEMEMLRKSPEAAGILLELELNELRELLKIEPLETNRKVLRYVLERSAEDIRWLLIPANRILHLLCRKRADVVKPEILEKYPFDILSHWKRFSQF